MAVTVAIDHPDFPEGTEFGIDYLGVVPNGGSLEVPDENVEMFEQVKGETVDEAFTDNGVVTVGGKQQQQQQQEPPPAQEGGAT